MVAVQKHSTPVLLSLTWALNVANFKTDTFGTITVLQETDKISLLFSNRAIFIYYTFIYQQNCT